MIAAPVYIPAECIRIPFFPHPCQHLPFVFLMTAIPNGNPLQYSYLKNPVDRGAWWVAVHRFAQSDTTEVT